MDSKEALTFRLKFTKKDVQEMLVRYAQLENLINGKEEKYLVEMTNKNGHFYLEFNVPLKEINQKEDVE